MFPPSTSHMERVRSEVEIKQLQQEAERRASQQHMGRLSQTIVNLLRRNPAE